MKAETLDSSKVTNWADLTVARRADATDPEMAEETVGYLVVAMVERTVESLAVQKANKKAD